MNNTKTASRQLKQLRQRAAKLADRVELATAESPDREVRQGGTRLSEVLEEWLEDLEELLEIGDDNLQERMMSFATRIMLAEQKVGTWKVPKKKASARKRGRKPRKSAEAA